MLLFIYFTRQDYREEFVRLLESKGFKVCNREMSFTEKHDSISKDDWMNRLDGLHIQRSDMNKLVMNYLVTGKVAFTAE